MHGWLLDLKVAWHTGWAKHAVEKSNRLLLAGKIAEAERSHNKASAHYEVALAAIVARRALS